MQSILHIGNALLLILFLSLPAIAADTEVPTLTRLHNAGITMPDGTVYPESAYTLTEVIAPGENVITKYEMNADNTVTAKYYRVVIKTEYGTGPDTQIWGFEKDADGKNVLVKDPTNPATAITVYYDSSNPLSEIENYDDSSDRPINGSFSNLSTEGPGAHYGGAVYNEGYDAKLGDITGDFVENYAYSNNRSAGGGAIYNNDSAVLGNITGDFISNYAEAVIDRTMVTASGGAIFNDGEIGNITGDFIGNYVSTFGYSFARGGAVYNYGYSNKIGNIKGNFIGNYASSTDSSSAYAYGGAIYNTYSAKIGNITGNFIGNYTFAPEGDSNGGAIYNETLMVGYALRSSPRDDDRYSQVGDISGDFVGNYALGTRAGGGAIYNDNGLIGKIKGDFIGNYAQSSYKSQGGAIYNNSGNMWDLTLPAIEEISGDFIGNYALAEGEETIAQGGAIYNVSSEGKIVNSSFINNYAKADAATGIVDTKGGAIYNQDSNLNIIADNGVSIFSGNYTETNGVKESNAIYVTTQGELNSDTGEFEVRDEDWNYHPYTSDDASTLTLEAKNNGIILFEDKITGGVMYEDPDDWTIKIYDESGKYKYNLNLTGDESGTIILNNNVDNANTTSEKVTLVLGKNNVFENSDFTIISGALNFLNGAAESQIAKSFNVNGNINIAADVDLANKSMDTLPSNTVVDASAKIGVNYLHLLNDANQDKTYIPFASGDYANQVSYTGTSPVAYSPIYKYQVDYLKETGEFLFTRGAGGSSSNPSDNFNPSVLPTPVNNQAGGYTTQLQTFNYAFQHSDTFMQIPAAQRFAIKNQNKYALSPTGDATDVGVFSPLLTKYETGGIWFKPYASFENIPLKNGPKVNNINYGTLIGFDSNLKSIKHGWERVLTGYIGYNGATQNFQGVTANQNGGLLGTTATFYKGNFFNATTLSVGATAGSNNTMYGSEDYTMLLAGIADKFGYNFEFKEGKYIIQPSMLLSYSFVNTFDYRNAAGVNIQSDPLNALQLAPGIKFIMNTKNGWQPYIGVNMVWNIMDQTKVKANDVRLPSMSIDPYVEYGVGVQRKWGERFMGYAQAMVHNGGRNGISLNGGFRWAIGKK